MSSGNNVCLILMGPIKYPHLGLPIYIIESQTELRRLDRDSHLICSLIEALIKVYITI